MTTTPESVIRYVVKLLHRNCDLIIKRFSDFTGHSA